MRCSLVFVLAWILSTTAAARAEVDGWEILKREPYADGKPIGEVGPCERISGRIEFTIDPANVANWQIVDLPLAPKSAEGKVAFAADFVMLVPVDRSKLNGTLFYEVNNRGNPTAPRLVDGDADEFLLRQGFVFLWSGWIAETLPGGGRVTMTAPVSLENGKPLTGIVRNEFVVDKPVAKASVSHRANQGSYRPSADGEKTAQLTMREREADERQPVPRDQWKFIVTNVEADGQRGQLPLVEIEVAGGLKAGWIYEVVYEAEGSLVQGVGLAGIRDAVSFLKYERSESNPLRTAAGQPLVERAIGFGTSQSGRCLRHFLWEGFNADEEGRQVFDGVIPHVAGGGLGSFNHRFASPTRTNGQHEEHTFPADYFPFTYGETQDPLSGKADSILGRSRATKTVPKVMHTQSSSEYWHRSGSLVHTDPLAIRDKEIPPEVRIYTFGGTQHGSGNGVPGPIGNGQLPNTSADYKPFLRALIVAMNEWIKDGKEPPPSVYPKISDGTLVGWKQKESGWPAIPGVNYPTVIHEPKLLNRGPDWETKRVATVEPPKVHARFHVRVPAFGPDANELGTLLHPAVAVPIGSYTGWNLRSEAIGAPGELLSLAGGYIPFAKTAANRKAAGDPRPALLERYKSFADYRDQYEAAAEKLVAERYLLPEDLPRAMALCEKFRPAFE
jgi:hypothetical protein